MAATIPSKSTVGVQPSRVRSLVDSPTSTSGSAARMSAASETTWGCQSMIPTWANAVSTRSKTLCARPVATT
jgi:hypothetical protein